MTEEVAENVEVTTEETVEEAPKVYSEDEFNTKMNEVLGKKIARKEARIRKEYEKKYGELESVLKAGTGKESVEEITDVFTEHYGKKGIEINKNPGYSEKEIEVLAKSDAAEIIGAGFEDVVEEIDRLTEVGFDKMTAREKAYFKVLAEHRKNTERQNDLAKIGVTEEEANSEEFQEFASKFNSSTPITEIYGIYAKTKPKKDIKPMGSLKSTPTDNTGVKDFYTVEEAKKFTKADFDKNPALYKAVCNSMQKW